MQFFVEDQKNICFVKQLQECISFTAVFTSLAKDALGKFDTLSSYSDGGAGEQWLYWKVSDLYLNFFYSNLRLWIVLNINLLCTSTMHLHYSPPLCTSTIHLHCAPPLFTSTVHLHYSPLLCTSNLHLQCAPPLFASTIHIHYIPQLCNSTVHFHYAPPLFTSTIHLNYPP